MKNCEPLIREYLSVTKVRCIFLSFAQSIFTEENR